TAKAIAFTDEAITGRINDARGMIESGQPRTLVMFDPASNVGFTAAMNILNQGRTVLFARSIEDGLNIVRSSSVTCIIASTRHMDDLVSLSAQTSGGVGVLPSVQRVIMGGSYMPASLLERIRTVFRCEIYQVYASTEAGAAGVNNISMMTAPDASTNRYIPCEQVRIVPIDGEDGETGAIEIHSSHMGRPFEGSLSMPVAAQPEWFRPGDLGYMDAEGLLVVVGRMDDLINMGGLKRPAEFFEGLLAQCPLVRDCAVIRVDAGGGPRIVVLVQYAGAPDDVGLEAWALKHPLRLAFDDLIPVASIARTEMGKIERARAREMAMQAMAKPTRH
ncbi:MAG: AMP-binding protein, partial [Beijerinckiaceae bacterium]|nr:AMP-binding protein [Beijerinckiaceae bacterium]